MSNMPRDFAVSIELLKLMIQDKKNLPKEELIQLTETRMKKSIQNKFYIAAKIHCSAIILRKTQLILEKYCK
jgi:hypothetical protein